MSINTEKKFKRRLDGIVVSDKTDKTVTVKVRRKFKHAKYSKYINADKKYYAHDEKNEAKIGDRVLIIESRPYSKSKKWELNKIY